MNSLFYQNGFTIILWFFIQIIGATLLGADDEFRADLVWGNETLKNGKEICNTFVGCYQKC